MDTWIDRQTDTRPTGRLIPEYPPSPKENPHCGGIKNNHFARGIKTRSRVCSHIIYSLNPFPKQSLVFTCLQYKSFENIVRKKEEIAHNKQFLLVPVFSTHLEHFLPFLSNLKLLSANSFNLEGYKICRMGKG